MNDVHKLEVLEIQQGQKTKISNNKEDDVITTTDAENNYRDDIKPELKNLKFHYVFIM